MSGGRLLLVIVSVVVAAAVAAGLVLLGSPQDERQRRLDQVRVTDLMALRSAVEVHHRREGTLPASLGELTKRSPLPIRMEDPAGGRQYEYETVDSTRYRLCAVFDFATPPEEMHAQAPEWAHGAGRMCFVLTLRPATRVVVGTESEPLLEGSPDSSP